MKSKISNLSKDRNSVTKKLYDTNTHVQFQTNIFLYYCAMDENIGTTDGVTFSKCNCGIYNCLTPT